MAVTVTHFEAPAGEFVQIFVGDTVAHTDLFPVGTAPDDDAIIAAWQASGVLLEERLDDYPNLPQDVDLAAFAAVGATRIIFRDAYDLGDDDGADERQVMRVVNANYAD